GVVPVTDPHPESEGAAPSATPAGPALPAPPVWNESLTLAGVGQCTVLLALSPSADKDTAGTHAPTASQQEQVERLGQALRSALAGAAQEARTSVEDELYRAHFLHQYMHGIAALSSNVAGLFRVLGIPREDAPGIDCSAGPAATDDYSVAADLVRTIDYLVRAEKNNALNCLAHLMPQFLPGVERADEVVTNPMEELRSILPAYVHQARKQFIEIAFDRAEMSPHMPLVRLERHSFQRMLHNLLSNAVKYSYHGIRAGDSARERVVDIWCTPRHDPHGRTCLLALQNYGIGIEPDELNRIGEPGYRGRLARREVEIGTGLGMSEARAVARAHRGYLNIQSRAVHG